VDFVAGVGFRFFCMWISTYRRWISWISTFSQTRCRVSRLVDVSIRRRCLAPAPLGQHSSEVDSMSEAMPRQVLTAQLIVDKNHAMVLANVTFKAFAAMASSRGHAEGQVYA